MLMSTAYVIVSLRIFYIYIIQLSSFVVRRIDQNPESRALCGVFYGISAAVIKMYSLFVRAESRVSPTVPLFFSCRAVLRPIQ